MCAGFAPLRVDGLGDAVVHASLRGGLRCGPAAELRSGQSGAIATDEELERLRETYRRLLNEPDEKKVSRLIADSLRLPVASSEHQTPLSHWRDYRQKQGWKVS